MHGQKNIKCVQNILLVTVLLFRGFRVENSAYRMSVHSRSDIHKCIIGKKNAAYTPIMHIEESFENFVQECACFGIKQKLNILVHSAK
jgi:hypothetical protein